MEKHHAKPRQKKAAKKAAQARTVSMVEVVAIDSRIREKVRQILRDRGFPQYQK